MSDHRQEKIRSALVSFAVPAAASSRPRSKPIDSEIHLLPIGVHRGGKTNADRFFRPFISRQQPGSDSQRAPAPDGPVPAAVADDSDDNLLLVNFRGRLFAGSHVELPPSCTGVVYDEIHEGEDERKWKEMKVGDSSTFSSFVAWRRAEDASGPDAPPAVPLRWLQFLQFTSEVQQPFSSENEVADLLNATSSSPAKSKTPPKMKSPTKNSPTKSTTPTKKSPTKSKTTTPTKRKTPSKTPTKRKILEEPGSAKKKAKKD